MRIPVLIIMALCCQLLFCHQAEAAAAPSANAGFRTLGVWRPETNLRLDISVWYPTTRRPRQLQYGPWEIYAAYDAPLKPGTYPLLLLSHATAGTRFSYHEMAAWLARCGFIVAAPAHEGDNMDDMRMFYSSRQINERIKHLEATIDALAADKDLQLAIDMNKIGVIGFSAGGTAGLVLGGATLSPRGWEKYCGTAKENDPDCNPWARRKISQMARELPDPFTAPDPRIKAVAAISPLYPMLFTGKTPPAAKVLLIQTAEEKDSTQTSRDVARLLGCELPMQLRNADVGALMSTCPGELAQALPELCHSIPPEQRKQIEKILRTSLVTFFRQVLTPTLPEDADVN